MKRRCVMLAPYVLLCAVATLVTAWVSFGSSLLAGDRIALSAQVAGDMQKTRFVAFLSKAVDFHTFLLSDPYRIIVDLPQTDIQVADGKGRGLVLSSRAGLLSEGKSRIVIDLVEPALVEKAEIMPAENGVPARLILDLTRTTAKSFQAAAKQPLPVIEKDSKAVAQNNPADKRPIIVIDPGHGGVDAGAHGRTTNTPEKEVTFDFCQTLKDQLEKTSRYRVVMTRKIDVYVPLDERSEIASGLKAELLISIHADALDPKKLGAKGLQEVRGGTIYTLADQASDEQSKAIAQNENKADTNAGLSNGTSNAEAVPPEIESILSDLESRTKKNRSLSFANYLISHLNGKMRFNLHPHRSANFRVLKSVGVPAVLIELGYLSNDEDERLLTSVDWRRDTASAIATAVNAFMVERQAHVPF